MVMEIVTCAMDEDSGGIGDVSTKWCKFCEVLDHASKYRRVIMDGVGHVYGGIATLKVDKLNREVLGMQMLL